MKLALKIIMALGANLFTGCWLVRGFQDLEIIGYVKEPATGIDIQPYTLIIQLGGYTILALLHVGVLIYLIYKANQIWPSANTTI